MPEVKAIVFQSAPTSHPPWVDICTESVRRWSRLRGASYAFVDDEEFMSACPEWLRQKCPAWIQPATDIARLVFAAKLLRQHDLAVWVDSDVLILDPTKLPLPAPDDAAFAREVWIQATADCSSLVIDENVANYVCAFSAGGAFLPWYHENAMRLARGVDGPLPSTILGTTFLTEWCGRRFSTIQHVANFSPLVTRALLHGGAKDVLARYHEALDQELFAANLCMSHENIEFGGLTTTTADMEKLANALARLTRGGTVEQIAAALDSSP